MPANWYNVTINPMKAVKNYDVYSYIYSYKITLLLRLPSAMKQSLSKYIAFLLRHHPEKAGITLDPNGWAKVSDLIEGISKTRPIDLQTLRNIVANDSKGRYSFSEDGEYIRANQGHSIDVDVELEEREPPETLYHGTCTDSVSSINSQGLLPMTRLYVHLSADVRTALNVGRRKGDHKHPYVFRVMAGEMFRDGHKFFLSENGVWLVKHVPPKYLEHQSQYRDAEE